MNIKNLFYLFLFLGVISLGSGILSAPASAQQTLTTGIVQKYIIKGMTQDEVVVALGSPNIVTQDANGKETWVYDKMSSIQTDRTRHRINKPYTLSAFFKSIFRNVFGGLKTILTLGLLGDEYEPEEALIDVAQVKSSQNTLTIVIKFDENNTVESYSYHSSRF